MKRKLTRVLFFMAFMVSIASATFAQEVIHGIVQDELGNPQSNVKVRLTGASVLSDLTMKDGKFTVVLAQGGSREVLFESGNFSAKKIIIPAGKDNITVTLSKESKVNEYGSSVDITAINAEMQDAVLHFESTDKDFQLWFDNRVMVDGAAFFGSDDDQIGNGAKIRRARFAIKTRVWKNWGGELDVDFSSDELSVKDAFIRYGWNNGIVKVGNFKEPFSMEATTSSRYQSFMESPMVTEMAPGRHIGFGASYWLNHFLFQAGVFTNVMNNVLIEDQNKNVGTDEGYSLTGRMVWIPVNKDNRLIHLGGSISYRTPTLPEYGDPTQAFRINMRAETDVNRKKYVDTDFIENSKYALMAGGELAAQYNNIKFQGEYIMQDIHRRNDLQKVNIQGWFAAATWMITGENYVYNSSESEFTRIGMKKNGKGAIEAALRYSYMDANDLDAGVKGGEAEIITAGINYYVNPSVKFMLNYSWVNQDRYANGKGKYTTDMLAPTGESGIDFSTIALRVEIDF